MIFTRIVMPVFFMLIGLISFIASINLPKAKLGDPYGPIYFPTIISLFLLLVSVYYFISELRQEYKENENLQRLIAGRAPVLIISTLILSLIYTYIFEKIGFLISTILFLGALLFIINGVKKWLMNIIIAVLFSYIAWYVFSKLLQVSLP